MLKTQEFVDNNGGFDALADQLGIKVRDYPEHRMVVLNYSQIDSPKTNPVVRECRGLALDYDLNVVARSFDRFFNAGEADCADFSLSPSTDTVHEKMDGSLIRCYFYDGKWHMGTRGTAFAEAETMMGATFFDLLMRIYRSVEDFRVFADKHLDPNVTYNLEFTSVENRVVTRYSGYSLHLLAARRNDTGEYVDVSDHVVSEMLWHRPRTFSFNTTAECMDAANSLPDLEEGYVVYRSGSPICKIKSPLYVVAHHIKGEGLTPRRVSDLIFTNEHEEYLSYFEEDRAVVQPYHEGYLNLLSNIDDVWCSSKDIESQKDFAMRVKDTAVAPFMFAMRKGQSVENLLSRMSSNAKLDLLMKHM